MYNNQHRKNVHNTHRRIKTDFSANLQPSHLRLINQSKAQLTRSFRLNNQHRSSSIYSKIAADSSRSATRTPSHLREYTYNKWYIQPNVRLKKSLLSELNSNEKDEEFAYNRLYEENTMIKDCPFLMHKNDKLKLLDQIPVHNLKLLEGFKKNQQMKKKRVPKIIELFLRKKISPNEG